MTPATKKLIKLLVEQAIANVPEESNPDTAEVLRDWTSRIHKVIEEIRTSKYISCEVESAGEKMMLTLRRALAGVKNSQNRAKQKEKRATKPFGRIPGVNDIPREKKNKPAL